MGHVSQKFFKKIFVSLTLLLALIPKSKCFMICTKIIVNFKRDYLKTMIFHLGHSMFRSFNCCLIWKFIILSNVSIILVCNTVACFRNQYNSIRFNRQFNHQYNT